MGPLNVEYEYDTSAANKQGSLEVLTNLRSKYLSNPIIGYLNINSLRGDKLNQLKGVLNVSPIDILCINETKLTYDFPDSQFFIEGYQYPPIRRDRSTENARRIGGGKLVYLKDGLITKRVKDYETLNAETVCIELNISHRK